MVSGLRLQRAHEDNRCSPAHETLSLLVLVVVKPALDVAVVPLGAFEIVGVTE